jgi:hypothetical protein
MKVQAKAKFSGLWMPWPKNLPKSATIELYVVEAMPNASAESNLIDSQPPLSPEEHLAEFMRLTAILFGDNYHYAPEHEEHGISIKTANENGAANLNAQDLNAKHATITNRFSSFALQEYLKEKYA